MNAKRTTERSADNQDGRRTALVLAGLALPFLVGLYAIVLAYCCLLYTSPSPRDS